MVVEATRFPEEVRRLPANTTVITGEEISRSAARTIPELLREQAGINMTDLFGNNGAFTTIDLRGFGVTGAQNTLVLLDGRRLNDLDLSGPQWPSIPLASIERIEILRGAGAVLYGDAASSGVINIVSRSPLRQGRSAEILERIATFGTHEQQLYGSAAGEAFGVNGSLYTFGSDGYRANNRNEQENGTLNLRWALGEGALDLRFGADRQRIRLPGGRFVQPSIGLDQYASDPRGTGTPNDYSSRDGRRMGLNFQQRFGDVELAVGLDHREKDQRIASILGAFSSFRADELKYDSFSPRVKVPFMLGGMRHRVTAGLDWNDWDWRSRRTDVPEHLSQPTNVVAIRQKSTGYYAQDSIDVTSSTIATVGWREESARYTGSDIVDPASPGCLALFGFCSAAGTLGQTYKQHAWELGLRQVLAPGTALFARSGRSFRLPNVEEIYGTDPLTFNQGFLPLRPQHARTVEAGVDWQQAAYGLKAAAFRSDVSDEIHLDPFTLGNNTNLPPSRREGVELDGRWQAVQALQVTAAYTYTRARFLSGSFPGSLFAIGTNLDITGRTVPLVPKHKLNATATWAMAERTRLSAAWTSVGSQLMDNDEPNTLGVRIPAYNVVDLKLTQDFKGARVGFTVNNAFDQHYFTYAVRSQFTADRYAVYPLPGRTFGVSLELSI